MSKNLTQEEVISRIKEKHGDKYSLIGEYKSKREKIKLHCNIHNIDFEILADSITRINRVGNPCPECKRSSFGTVLDLICPICKKDFRRTKSSLKGKSDFYFCSRECKDIAARIGSGIEIQPDFYGTGLNYRIKAFRLLEHKCEVCGWDEDERILEVHHIDENRENNEILNLKILCPTCHRKITLGYYKLENNKLINKNKGETNG